MEMWKKERDDLLERLNHGEFSAAEREKLISRIEELFEDVTRSKRENENKQVRPLFSTSEVFRRP